MLKGKEKARAGEEESESCSLIEKRPIKSAHDGGGKMRCKTKRVKRSNGENNKESPTKLIQRKLADSLSPCKVVAGDRPRQEQ